MRDETIVLLISFHALNASSRFNLSATAAAERAKPAVTHSPTC